MTTQLARNLSLLMRNQNFSQLSLAEAAGVEQSTIQRILAGRSKEPKESTLAKLAKPLGVSTDALRHHQMLESSVSVRVRPESQPARLDIDMLTLAVAMVSEVVAARHARPTARQIAEMVAAAYEEITTGQAEELAMQTVLGMLRVYAREPSAV